MFLILVKQQISMKKRAISALALVMLLSSAISQETIELFNVDNFSNINADARGLNTYRKIKVNLSNTGSSDKKINISCGTFFENGNTNEQSLVVLFKDQVYLDGNERSSIELITACMDASKASPSGHSNWTIENDKGLGDLIRFYHSNRSMIALMTSSDQHSTKEKQINFLQIAVWAYYDCEEDKMVDFSAKYMFDGNRQDAQDFIDVTLPMIKIFINLYKSTNR